jgi:hypothetical protein
MTKDPKTPATVKIDLHGYHPSAVVGPPMAMIIEQAWEMGADRICFIHGHGRARGISPGFVNTNTGYFGLCVRRELRSNKDLRRWIKYTTLDCGDWGATTMKLKANANPTRRELDLTVLPERRYATPLRAGCRSAGPDGRWQLSLRTCEPAPAEYRVHARPA